MDTKLLGVAFGIRHRRSFHVAEIAGAIVDDIANEADSPFYKDKYVRTEALMEALETKGRVLFTNEGESSLAVDIDNVVYETRVEDLDKIITELKDTYAPYISKKIFIKHKIENINRLGIVFTFRDKNPSKIYSMMSQFTKNIFPEPEHVALRFSQKGVSNSSIIKKDINDFTNAIVTVQKRDADVIYKFDFQLNYSPEIKTISDIDLSNFLDSARADLQKSFFNWISTDSHDKKKQ